MTDNGSGGANNNGGDKEEEEEEELSVPRGGPIYVPNVVGPLTSVPLFLSSILQELQVPLVDELFIICITLLFVDGFV